MAENSIELDSRLRGNDDGAGNNGYQAYPECKDSGVEWLDDIPRHWKTIPVGRAFRRIKRTDNTDKELLSVYRDYGVIPKSSRYDNFNKPSEDLTPFQF